MKVLRLLLLTACFIVASGVKAGTVDWGAQVDNGLTDSLGAPLAPGSLLLVGTFNINDATIQANANNPTFLAQHFIQFGSSTIGNNVSNLAGYWFQHSVNSISSLGVGSSRIYIWAFNSSSMNTATEQGIFSQTENTQWFFPASDDPLILPNRSIDLTDLTTGDPHVLATGADIVIGGFNSTNNLTTNQPMFSTALILIPEPTTYALAAIGGAIVFLLRRRSSR